MTRFVFAVAVASAVLACACTGSKNTSVDAAPKRDAPGGRQDGPRPDAPRGVPDASIDSGSTMTCTGKLYDSCNPAASNCMGSTTCHDFAGKGFAVCTQACGAGCPLQNGNAVTCNGMNICVPTAPNPGCTAP